MVEARNDLPLHNATLQELLSDVMKHKDSWPFIRPVQKIEVNRNWCWWLELLIYYVSAVNEYQKTYIRKRKREKVKLLRFFHGYL